MPSKPHQPLAPADLGEALRYFEGVAGHLREFITAHAANQAGDTCPRCARFRGDRNANRTLLATIVERLRAGGARVDGAQFPAWKEASGFRTRYNSLSRFLAAHAGTIPGGGKADPATGRQLFLGITAVPRSDPPAFQVAWVDGPAAYTARPGGPGPRVPPRPPRFVDRAGREGRLLAQLRRGGVVLLCEMPGSGKTALARSVANAAVEADAFPGGVAWLDCGRRPDLAECLRQVSDQLLGTRLEGLPLQRLRERVDERLLAAGGLVVLDRFEEVEQDGVIAGWLGGVAAPGAALVTTTRRSGLVRGAGGPDPMLTADEAMELFVRVAAERGARRPVPDLVRRLCEAVGHLPLAVELLAGRYAAGVTLRRLADDLDRGLGSVADTTRPEARHRDLAACLRLVVDGLSDPSRDLLLRTSVLPYGLADEVLTRLDGGRSWEPAARELVRACLWHMDGDRYAAHPLVTRFASECLAAGPAARRAAAARRAGRALFDVLRAHGAVVSPGSGRPPAEIGESLGRIEDEWANLAACAAATVAAGDGGRLLGVFGSIWPHMAARGRWAEWEAMLRAVLADRRRAADGAGTSRALGLLGYLYWLRRRRAPAERALREAVRLCRRHGDAAHLASHLNDLGKVYLYLGRGRASVRLALKTFRAALAAVKPLAGSRAEELHVRNNMTRAYIELRQWRQAEACLSPALAAYAANPNGDPDATAAALTHLGEIRTARGDVAEAEAVLREAMSLAGAVGHRRRQAAAQDRLGDLCRSQCRLEEARQAYRAAIEHWSELGDEMAARRVADKLRAIGAEPPGRRG